jgi:hypothetical protein
MMKKYLLVTDATADQVKQATGLDGHDTPLGALIEKPRPFNMQAAMEELDRALHPNRCICGRYAIMHRLNCPAACYGC